MFHVWNSFFLGFAAQTLPFLVFDLLVWCLDKVEHILPNGGWMVIYHTTPTKQIQVVAWNFPSRCLCSTASQWDHQTILVKVPAPPKARQMGGNLIVGKFANFQELRNHPKMMIHLLLLSQRIWLIVFGHLNVENHNRANSVKISESNKITHPRGVVPRFLQEPFKELHNHVF